MVQWVIIRILIIIIFTITMSWQISFPPQIRHPVSFYGLLKFFILGAIGIQFILGINYRKNSSIRWKKPSWKENPFNYKQPAQFYHFFGWLVVIFSLSIICLGFFRGFDDFLYTLELLAFGLGILIGIHFSSFIYKDKYINTD